MNFFFVLHKGTLKMCFNVLWPPNAFRAPNEQGHALNYKLLFFKVIHWHIFINFALLVLDVVLSFSFLVEKGSSEVKDGAGDPLCQAHSSSGTWEVPGFKGVQVCEVTRSWWNFFSCVVHLRVVATRVPITGSMMLQVRGWWVTSISYQLLLQSQAWLNIVSHNKGTL